MRTYADDAQVVPPALPLNRDLGEGPLRCCGTAVVTADSLVWYGPDEMAAPVLAKVRARHKQVPAEGMYLCGGCRETLRREKVIARTEMPLSRELKRPNDR